MGADRRTALASVLASIALTSALAAVAVSGCGAGGEPPRTEIRHADLQAFGASAPEDRSRRVILLGLDGASWEYLRPRLDDGSLPHLARLVRGGASATLRSVECYFTPPAWTTLFTGVLPERHGVYSFGRFDAESASFRGVGSRDRLAPAVWDVASRAGRRVAVVSAPATYPATPVDGVMVSGLMTPKRPGPPLRLSPAERRAPPLDERLRSFSPVVSSSLQDEHNVLFAVFTDGADDGERRYDEVRLTVVEKGVGPVARRTLGEYRFPVGEFSPWIRVRVPGRQRRIDGWTKIRFAQPDASDLGYQVGPVFLPVPGRYTHPPSLARDLERRFGFYLPHEFLPLALVPAAARDAADHARWLLDRDDWDLYLHVFGQTDNAHHLVGFAPEVLPVYRALDRLVGDLMLRADAGTAIVLASDHGFAPVDHAVDLNQHLGRVGLLQWASPGVIDFEHTLVFHNMWYLHFNRRLLSREELSRRGIGQGPDEAPADALARHVREVARALTDADGTPFPVEVVRLPDDAVGPAPDMAVHGSDRYWIEFWNVDRPSGAVVRALSGDERWKHARDGIFAAWGAGIRSGVDLGVVPIADVAPTLIDLLGLPVADELEGVPIAGLLEPAVARARPIHRVARYRAPERDGEAPPDPLARFEDTLRALGYVRE